MEISVTLPTFSILITAFILAHWAVIVTYKNTTSFSLFATSFGDFGLSLGF